MTVFVSDKKSLKKAFDSRVEEIIVTGNLAKKFKKVQAIKRASPAALAIASGAIAAAIPTVIAAAATAPITGGVSHLIAAPLVATEAAVVSTSLSVSTGVAVSIIVLASSIGVSTLIAVFKNYQAEFKVKQGKTVAHFRLKK